MKYLLALAMCVLALGSAGCSAWRDPAGPAPSPAPTAERPGVSGEPTVSPPPAPQVPTPEPAAVPTPEAPVKPTPAPSSDPVKTAPTPEAPAKPTDNKTRSWWYTANDTHAVPSAAPGASALLKTYGGRYTGPNRGKVYLTFDQGYEAGFTPDILDALKRNQVRATFFVTDSYIRNNRALVRRMVNEGHVVGNHSATHPSMPDLTRSYAEFKAEFTLTEDAFRDATGHEMVKLFRPPRGEYSALSLWRTQRLGYESVFWSFAHRDWLLDDQPPVDVTIDRILRGSHPGAIYLLHGVSASDTAALDEAIAGLRQQGYTFGILTR